jgi:hypothetical protein
MGFHTRYLSKDFITATFKNKGIVGVIDLVIKPDSIVYDTNCTFCENVIDAIKKDDLSELESIFKDI